MDIRAIFYAIAISSVVQCGTLQSPYRQSRQPLLDSSVSTVAIDAVSEEIPFSVSEPTPIPPSECALSPLFSLITGNESILGIWSNQQHIQFAMLDRNNLRVFSLLSPSGTRQLEQELQLDTNIIPIEVWRSIQGVLLVKWRRATDIHLSRLQDNRLEEIVYPTIHTLSTNYRARRMRRQEPDVGIQDGSVYIPTIVNHQSVGIDDIVRFGSSSNAAYAQFILRFQPPYNPRPIFAHTPRDYQPPRTFFDFRLDQPTPYDAPMLSDPSRYIGDGNGFILRAEGRCCVSRQGVPMFNARTSRYRSYHEDREDREDLVHSSQYWTRDYLIEEPRLHNCPVCRNSQLATISDQAIITDYGWFAAWTYQDNGIWLQHFTGNDVATAPDLIPLENERIQSGLQMEGEFVLSTSTVQTPPRNTQNHPPPSHALPLLPNSRLVRINLDRLIHSSGVDLRTWTPRSPVQDIQSQPPIDLTLHNAKLLQVNNHQLLAYSGETHHARFLNCIFASPPTDSPVGAVPLFLEHAWVDKTALYSALIAANQTAGVHFLRNAPTVRMRETWWIPNEPDPVVLAQFETPCIAHIGFIWALFRYTRSGTWNVLSTVEAFEPVVERRVPHTRAFRINLDNAPSPEIVVHTNNTFLFLRRENNGLELMGNYTPSVELDQQPSITSTPPSTCEWVPPTNTTAMFSTSSSAAEDEAESPRPVRLTAFPRALTVQSVRSDTSNLIVRIYWDGRHLHVNQLRSESASNLVVDPQNTSQ